MPAYKLTYFNGRGTAEIVRLVFAAAGIAYEDVRLEQDKWPELKPKTPMGQVPILEVDGTMLCQSNSIARYVAKVAGLAGKTPMEQARVDMIMDVMDDMGKKGNAVFWEKDEETKAEKKKEYEETFLPQFFTCVNKLVGDSGYFVGNELTLADITYFNTTNLVGNYFKLPNVDEFSGLKK
ncbi:hematopoietic prostaglandin D synthase-like, partial [Branchiostoma floridae]|uniref:glutathione transferase n=1 Tax=Branchiostoma floridae TaxID=7739 RepID=A0A9J7MKK7_BRAFL